MQAVLTAIDRINQVGAAIAALSALLLSVMLILEVVLSSFFAYSQPWAVEFSGYFLCFILFSGSGWALRNGGHIRVTALTAMLPRALEKWVDAAVTAFALGMVGFAAFSLAEQTWRTIELGSRSYYPLATPLWIPQSLLTLGVASLALAFLARLIRRVLDEDMETLRPGASE